MIYISGISRACYDTYINDSHNMFPIRDLTYDGKMNT